MVMAQSLFKRLKEADPRNEIAVMAPAWTKPLLGRMPEVTESLDAPFQHGELNWLLRRRIGRDLRGRGFTHAIVLPNSFKSALIPFHAGIPERIGWRGEWRDPLLTDCRHLDKKKHPLMAQRYIALALPRDTHSLPVLPGVLPGDTPLTLSGTLSGDTHSPLPETSRATRGDTHSRPDNERPAPQGESSQIGDWLKPQLQVRSDELELACLRLELKRERPILALCPGAEYGPSKQWPAANHIELANLYLRRGWQVWLFGSNKDRAIATEISAGIAPDLAAGCRDLTGRTRLAEAIDLLSATAVVVSNDSGLMHIAAALGKPLAAIYGSSSPAFTPPLSGKVELLATGIDCQPCYRRECPYGHLRCLTAMRPATVADAIDRLRAESSGEAANCGF